MTQRMFGPYRIEELLGRGGMGEVYRAYDTGQQRMVALKLLLPSLAGDSHYTERFRRESETVAQLREPHVIPIHRHGEIDGQLFIDMRLVEGAHLGTVLRGGPLDPRTAVDVVEQIASALDAAHADGLVHRDVKPSNVLCAGRGRPTDFVYLVDFGIARTVEGAGMTATGAAIGSIEYMAPERFLSDRVDHRADVYSLACLLFECLTARRPFVTAERLGVIRAHLEEPPPVLSAVRPGAPAALDAVIAQGLAKSPADRHPAASVFAAAARAALGSAAPAQPPAAPATGGRWWTRTNAAPAATPASSPPSAPAPGPPTPTPTPTPLGSPATPASGWWQATSTPPSTPPAPPATPASGWWQATSAPPPTPPASPATPTALFETRHHQPKRPATATPSPTAQGPGSPTSGLPPTAPAPGTPTSGPPPTALPPTAPGASRPGGTWWGRKATALHPVGAAPIVIGRAPECDIVLTDPLVSRRHAELRQAGTEHRIVDLGSWNGTFVNGHRTSQAATIGAGDIVGIGHALLHLQGGTLVEYTDSGDISFEADGLAVTRSGRRLLDGVGFALPQRSLLAVVGPSGAGKSTLLGALTGQRPADSGEVRYAGRDLYASYDELRQRIGLVPQDDILHPQLTVRRALRYAAELRFPADTSAAERNTRVEEVLGELGLADHADQRISTLSGGQRKRTSVALELLTRPSLLFLDEPTSGLDPGMDKSVMQTLRTLADDGRTVVVVTHSPAQLHLCDRLLVLASGGRLAYFGPPGEALGYFGQRDFADMFLLLDQSRDVDWTARFRASPQYAKYGMPSGAARPTVGPAVRPAPAVPDPPPRQQPALRQFAVLARRYLSVIAADRAYALFLLALPLVLSLFAQLLPGGHGLSWKSRQTNPDDDIAPLMLMLVLGCAFTGFAGAFRELVKERSVFRREQAIGLSRSAYLWSKLAVLGMITSVQAVILAFVGLVGKPGPDTPLALGSGVTEVAVAMIAVALAAMVQGLLVSALISNADRGMPILVVVLLLQFLLCGLLIPLNGRPPLEQLAYLMPARWGFAMVAATTGYRQGDPDRDPLWKDDAGTWALDLAALLLLTAAVAAATWPVLRRGSTPRKGR
ncbi:ABC transport system ATP-binding/permease protein [Frankia sp. Hr75.2]|nr:ABC transport system ATP-binding/permease protein [Frankia sp. Hr75.2]